MKKFAALLAALPLAGCISLADAGSSGRRQRPRPQQWPGTGGLPPPRPPLRRREARQSLRRGPAQQGFRSRLTVLSVDGVNALNGQTAATSQSGYVLSAGQSAEIAGWRKSMDDVAAFYFTRLEDSYAGRTDRPQNVGVIGVAVYREAAPPPPQVTMPSREADAAGKAESASPNAAAKAAAPASEEARDRQAASRLGTGHGERISAPTQYTEFRRASDSPAEMLTIYYDSRARLLAQGIIPRPRPTPNPLPNPFPGGFTPDPRS
jgi:hypothetical protein